AVTQGAHGSVTLSAGAVSYKPVADYFGGDTFTYTIGDGNGGSAVGTVSVTVTGINDAPRITLGPNQNVAGNSGAKSFANWATGISPGPNEASQTLTVTVANTNPGLFTAQPALSLTGTTGTLTYTPANVTGTATVTVT